VFSGTLENFQGTQAHCAVIFAVAQLSCFINFSSFKVATKNNANFEAISSKQANFDEVQFNAVSIANKSSLQISGKVAGGV